MSKLFYDMIKKHTDKTPNKIAVIDGDSALSYSQLLEQVEKFSGAIGKLSLSSESKIGILCLNQTTIRMVLKLRRKTTRR